MRGLVHPEIQYKKPKFQYNLHQEYQLHLAALWSTVRKGDPALFVTKNASGTDLHEAVTQGKAKTPALKLQTGDALAQRIAEPAAQGRVPHLAISDNSGEVTVARVFLFAEPEVRPRLEHARALFSFSSS
eukprot:726700-Rhodomonas_salina.1